jgi:nucleoside-diphosphate-sugar epimerase
MQFENPGTLTLITGASGFAGGALSAAMISAGWRIRCALRQPAEIPRVTNEDDTGSALRSTNMVVGDIGPDTDWSRAVAGVDCVVHLAARVHKLRDTVTDAPANYGRVNVQGSERLARAAAHAGVRRLVFVSSIKVNGEQSPFADKALQVTRGFTERDPARPSDAYAISKWEAELALARVSAETGLEVVVLRPPLVYGPGVKANFLRLLQLVDHGFPLPFARVRNKRSLLYIGNLVSAIMASCRHPQARGHTFLLSDGEDLSTPELIRRLAQMLNRPARLLSCPTGVLRLVGSVLGKREVVGRLIDSLEVDPSLARQTLEWAPPSTVNQGLQATVSWYQRSSSHASRQRMSL